jgi:hypothetical protein
MYGTCWHMLLVHFVTGLLQVDWYSFTTSISHSDSVIVVPSFYFLHQGSWTGQGQVVVATFRL